MGPEPMTQRLRPEIKSQPPQESAFLRWSQVMPVQRTHSGKEARATRYSCLLYFITTPSPLVDSSHNSQSNCFYDVNLIKRPSSAQTLWRLAILIRIKSKGLNKSSRLCQIWHTLTSMNSLPPTPPFLIPIQTNRSFADFQKCQAQSFLQSHEDDVSYARNVLSPDTHMIFSVTFFMSLANLLSTSSTLTILY